MIWGKTSSYTGSDSDLQREKRMSEWQRSSRLPASQREAVQARMIQDPYDREASSLMERINARISGSGTTPPRDAAAQALQEYEQTAPSIRGISRPQSGQAGGAGARRGLSAAGDAFTTGEINGRQVVVPTAGNYDAYRSGLAKLGLGESPDVGAYQYAMQLNRLDPNTVYKAQSDERVAGIRADAMRDANRQKDLAKQAEQDRKDAAAREKQAAAEQKVFNTDFSKANTQLNQIRNKDGYGFYVKNWQGLQRDFASRKVPYAGQIAELDAQGIPYSLVDVKGRGGKSEKRPMLINRGEFDPYKYDPTRWDNEVAVTNQLRNTPGGDAAVNAYMDQKYPFETQWKHATQAAMESPTTPLEMAGASAGEAATSNALAPPATPATQYGAQQQHSPQELAEADAKVTAEVQRRIAAGSSPQQAARAVLQLTQVDPRRYQQAMLVLQRRGLLQQNPNYYNDRILSTQTGR